MECIADLHAKNSFLMSVLNNKVKESEDDFAYEDFTKQKPQDSLFLYEAESQILCLYDQLVELRLEKAILRAQIDTSPGTSTSFQLIFDY